MMTTIALIAWTVLVARFFYRAGKRNGEATGYAKASALLYGPEERT